MALVPATSPDGAPPGLVVVYWNGARVAAQNLAAPEVVVRSKDRDARDESGALAAILQAVARQLTGSRAASSPAAARADVASSHRSDRADRPAERFGDVEVDPGARTVTRRGVSVSLTATEFDLVMALLRRRGNVAPRDELLQELWRLRGAPSRALDTHICSLRRKLEPRGPGARRHIETVRAVGYRLTP